MIQTQRLVTPAPGVLSLPLNSLSVIVPVYQGEKTLDTLVSEILPLTHPATTAKGYPFSVTEVVLVWDGAIDDSSSVIEALSLKHSFIRPVWLSRNFGQHAATLAGISGCTGDWIVTLDEDGLHNPSDIPRLLDQALTRNEPVVYGVGANKAPHGMVRNLTSRMAHWFFSRFLGDKNFDQFSSYRLIRGDIGRSLAAFCGNGVYLDAALNWVAASCTSISVALRTEGRPTSGYRFSTLFDHFSRMIFCSKRTPLRLVFGMGIFTILLSIGLTTYAFCQKISGNIPIQGWTSLFILISFLFGFMMLAIGILAEYIGLILSQSMGKPLFLIQSTPPKVTGRL